MSLTKSQGKPDKKAEARRQLGDIIAHVADMSNELKLTTQARIDPPIIDGDQHAQIKLSKLITGFDTCAAVCIIDGKLFAANNTGNLGTSQECTRLLVECNKTQAEEKGAIRNQIIDHVFASGSSYLKDQFGRDPHLLRKLNGETRDLLGSDIDKPTEAKLQSLRGSVVGYDKLLAAGEGSERASSDEKEAQLAKILGACNDLRKSEHPRLQNFKVLLQPMISEISQDVDIVLANAQLRKGMPYLASGAGFVSGRTGQSVSRDSDLFTHAETKLELHKDCGQAKIFTTKLACDACYILCEDRVLGTHGKAYAWPVPESLTSAQLDRMTVAFKAQEETLTHAMDAMHAGATKEQIKERFKLHEFGPDTPLCKDQGHGRAGAASAADDTIAQKPLAAASPAPNIWTRVAPHSQPQLSQARPTGAPLQGMSASQGDVVASTARSQIEALTRDRSHETPVVKEGDKGVPKPEKPLGAAPKGAWAKPPNLRP
jgi:hypothetical protein